MSAASGFLDPEAAQELLRLEDVHRRLAATDPGAFNSYILRNEETGGRIVNSARHHEMQDFLSENERAVIWAHVEGGKTQQVSVGRVLFEIKENHNLRVAIVSNTFGQAEKVCRSLGKYILESEQFREIAPDVERHTGMPWTANQFTIKRSAQFAKDPTVQTCGIYGKILGARIDLLILDDVLGYNNTRTPGQRKEVISWFKSDLEGRLTANSRVWAVGMIWHPDDLYHLLAENPLYASMRGPVLDAEGNSTWPEVWPTKRIEHRRVEMGPIEFQRQMMCQEVSDHEARFRPEWVELCKKRGRGKQLAYMLHDVPSGFRVYTGVDLGVRDDHDASETVLFTIAVHPNEDREILMVEAGKWSGPEIVERIIDTHVRYKSIIYVENVAAQNFILQFTAQKSAVPVKPFTTTGSKMWHPEFGLESLGVEMSNGKWIIPCKGGSPAPEVQKWISELLTYDPRGHAGDRLMASWFAREGARLGRPKKLRGRRVDLLSR